MAGAGKEYQLAIKIAGKLDNSFTAAISQASTSMKALGAFGSVAGSSMKTAAGALTATATAAAGIGVASVSVGREFEAAMDSVAATAGATEEEYDKLRAAAMEMGRVTSKTATESASALEYMALAGWSVDQAVTGLPSILRLSEATGLDLAQTSDLVTDSMSALGVTVDGLAGYLDIAAKANNKSNQTAEQLMEAYLGVGGTMKNLNVPLEESATALGVLANRGIKGSEAGTALNAIMINLTTGTGQAGKMMEQLGISAFDSEGNFIGLEETLQLVNGAMSGLTEEERNAALAALGGKVHVDALNNLMSGLNTTTAEGVSEWAALEGQLYSAEGALEEMAGVKLDNLTGDMATFQSAVEDAGIKIYDHLQTPLRDVVQFGTDQVYLLSDALVEGGFTGMAEALGGILAETLTQAAAFAPTLVDAAGGLAQSLIQGLSDNAPALMEAIGELLTSGITAFMGFYADFWSTGALLLAQLLEGMVDQMPDIIQTGITTVQNLSAGITSQLPTILSAATEIAVRLTEGLGDMIPELIRMGAEIIAQLAEGIVQAAPQLLTAVIDAVFQVAESLLTTAPALISTGMDLIGGLADGIIAGLEYLFAIGPDIIVSLAEGLMASLPELIIKAGDITTSFVGGLVGALPTVTQGGITLIIGLVDGIVQNIPLIVSTATEVVTQIIEAILASLPLVLDAGIQLLTGIVQGITQNLPLVASAVTEVVTQVGEAVLANLPLILDAGIQLLTSLIRGISQNLPAIASAAVDIIGRLLEGIAQALPQIISAGADLVTQLVTGIGQMLPEIAVAAIQIITGLVQGISSNPGAIIQSGIDIITTLRDGFLQAIPFLISQIPELFAGVIDGILSIDWLQVGSDLITAIGQGIAAAWGSIRETFAGWKGFFSGLVDDIKGAFANVVSIMSAPIEAARDAIKGAIDRIKGFMNFDWELPKLKLPHFSVTGSFSLNPLSIPQFGIEWYKEGGILDGAQIFGATGNTLLGGGEAGKEAVLPLSELWTQMRSIMADVVTGTDTSALSALAAKLDSIAVGTGGGMGDLLDGLTGAYDYGDDDDDDGGEPGPVYEIVYSPTYQFYGDAPTEEDLTSAARISQEEFNSMMDEYIKSSGRRRF